MSSKHQNKLVHTWESGGDKFRLISYANVTAGYHDGYILERAHVDALGGESWTQVLQWDKNSKGALADDGYRNALADAVRELS